MWYRTKLYSRSYQKGEQNCATNTPSFKDSIVHTTPAEQKEQGTRSKALLGTNYSRESNTVPVQVLDVKNVEGGLIPDNIGGNHFRTGLRFQNN